jgi:Restriction endonuclease
MDQPLDIRLISDLRTIMASIRGGGGIDGLERHLLRGSFSTWQGFAGTPVAQPEIREKLKELDADLAEQRTLAQEALNLVAGTSAATLLGLARESQRRTDNLQAAITFITAFLLVPGLLAAVYASGIAVPGGDNAYAKAGWLAGIMLFGAAATVGTLRIYTSEHKKLAAVTGVAAVLMIAGVFAIWARAPAPASAATRPVTLKSAVTPRAAAVGPATLTSSETSSPTAALTVTASALDAAAIDQATRDYVTRQLSTYFKGHGFAQLVGHLLDLMGYTTTVSPPGKDYGVDSLAHRGVLGLEPPLIKVQVKSSEGSIGAPLVRELLGGLAPAGEVGLFVTLGHYTPDALALARARANLTLIDGTRFIDLLLAHYHELDDAYRERFPLKRVWARDLSSTSGSEDSPGG